MAVEIKYVVVRGGVEKMTFASKKEADAYDKLLDTADELMTLLAGAPVQLAPEQQESSSGICCKTCCAVARGRGSAPGKTRWTPISPRENPSRAWREGKGSRALG